MLKAFFTHLYCVVMANTEIKIGLGSGAAGAAAYKASEIVQVNTVWDHLAHLGLVISVLVGSVALLRSIYTFRKEWKQDRFKKTRNGMYVLMDSEIVEE